MGELPMRPVGRRPTNLDYAYDLSVDEIRRRQAVLEAIGDPWDPVQRAEDELLAYQMLFCTLDDEQQSILEDLVRARELPDRG